ncbi:MAG: hypothetical protein N3D85_06945 [Candidatus Bathyarchaeota archaeon]|nr:hypothetical protein [Candidatus Bathyarchaeota archaeon]
MAKILKLPDAVYEDLSCVSKELTAMAEKPVSLSMTVYLLTEIYRAHVRDPCARDHFRQRLVSSNIMSPEEFENACDKNQAGR